jgi:hypothetical protein
MDVYSNVVFYHQHTKLFLFLIIHEHMISSSITITNTQGLALSVFITNTNNIVIHSHNFTDQTQAQYCLSAFIKQNWLSIFNYYWSYFHYCFYIRMIKTGHAVLLPEPLSPYPGNVNVTSILCFNNMHTHTQTWFMSPQIEKYNSVQPCRGKATVKVKNILLHKHLYFMCEQTKSL